jgi:hypothetical protein
LQLGFALCEISTVPIADLIQIFDLDMSEGLANGVLVGIMPVGSIFGSILNPYFVRKLSRK